MARRQPSVRRSVTERRILVNLKALTSLLRNVGKN
jgi:hypothetical protein